MNYTLLLFVLSLSSLLATAPMSKASAEPLVILNYADTPEKSDIQALRESGALEDGIAFINESFNLTREIKVSIGAEDGPLYDPSISEIQIPYQFYSEVIDRVEQIEDDQQQQVVFANDAMLHTLFHELGHALVDQLDLPVVGKEEDAVDGLASMLLLEFYDDGADMAANAAELFALEGEERGELEDADFWGEHSLDEQRYFSTLCHIVGSDPQKYDSLGEQVGFSEERVEICTDTYNQLVDDWIYLLDNAFIPR